MIKAIKANYGLSEKYKHYRNRIHTASQSAPHHRVTVLESSSLQTFKPYPYYQAQFVLSASNRLLPSQKFVYNLFKDSNTRSNRQVKINKHFRRNIVNNFLPILFSKCFEFSKEPSH